MKADEEEVYWIYINIYIFFLLIEMSRCSSLLSRYVAMCKLGWWP